MKFEYSELTLLILALENYIQDSEKYNCRFLVTQSNKLLKKIKEKKNDC